jgi:hypothetical protein
MLFVVAMSMRRTAEAEVQETRVHEAEQEAEGVMS